MEYKNVEHKLPTIADLHEANLSQAFKQDQLNLLLSQPPAKKWLKKHPLIKVKNSQGKFVDAEYIPRDKLDFLLRKIFGQYKEEILREGQLFNSCYVALRLHYYNPIIREWQYHDGIGAVGVQTDKGESAGNMEKIKADAVMKALPSAASYAFKNACKKFGALFGGELNNFDIEEFVPSNIPYQKSTPEPDREFLNIETTKYLNSNINF